MVTTSSGQQGQLSIPGTVIGACVLWIIYGAIGLLGGLVTLSVSKGTGIGQTLIALAFIVTGIQVLMGKASGLIGSGIACLLLASLGLLVVTTLNSALDGRAAMPGWIITIVMINSGLLATAGILAIVGNGKYKEWRKSRGR